MDDFDPFGFRSIRDSMEKGAALARKAAKGLPPEQIVPGALVTLSSCKATGDRSYTDDIYEVLACNGGCAALRATGLCAKPWTDRPAVIQLHEREFYAAEALAQAIRDGEGAEAPRP